MKKEDAKSMIERVRKCEENAQRVSDPFLREAYARFASYWKRTAHQRHPIRVFVSELVTVLPQHHRGPRAMP